MLENEDFAIDSFYCHPNDIDIELFSYWVKGKTESESSILLYSNLNLQLYAISWSHILAETRSNYQQFQSLEENFENPVQFLTNYNLSPINDAEKIEMLIKYYHLEESLCLEMLGKKLNQRDKRDLEPFAEALNLPIRSCRRQIDNVKRISKYFEESFQQQQQQQQDFATAENSATSLNTASTNQIHRQPAITSANAITSTNATSVGLADSQHHHTTGTLANASSLENLLMGRRGETNKILLNRFIIPESQIWLYCTVCFMNIYRFDVNKKKLSYLSLQDYEQCVGFILNWWSTSFPAASVSGWGGNSGTVATPITAITDTAVCKLAINMELDNEFFVVLKDLKILTEKDLLEEIKAFCLKFANERYAHLFSKNSIADLDNKFKIYWKNIISIATNLNHSKELKDFFIDIHDKLIEPIQASGWPLDNLRGFAQSLNDAVMHSRSCQKHALGILWERFQTPFFQCILCIYEAHRNF